MKLLAIDGNSIINRAFYGIKQLTTKDGQYTNGIYGFINILNKLCNMEHPDGVVVAFDIHKPTFRHEKYAEYKAGRKGMPEELRTQMPLLKEWLTLAGYHIVSLEGYEADDILGTLAFSADQSEDNTCVIATGDRDSLQLISDNTRVLLTVTKAGKPELTVYDKEKLFEKYGLTPDGMLELKSLMGDSSDNIPGVPGVGEKTATDLITKFGSVDYIYENIDTLDIKDSVRNKLIAGKESAYLSRFLGKIRRDVPINTDFEAYRPAKRQEARLAALMTRLELFKLMEQMGVNASDSATPDGEEKTASFSQKTVSEMKITSPTDIVLSQNGEIAAVLCGSDICEAKTEDIKNLLESDAEKRVYDYKTLCNICKKLGIAPKNIVFDSMLAAYLVSPSASSYAIDRLITEYNDMQVEVEGEPSDLLKTAAQHTRVCDNLTKLLKEREQYDLLEKIEIPLAAVLSDMENTGFFVDAVGIAEYGEILQQRIEVANQDVFSAVGHEFNLNSTKQLGVALFEELGLPAKKKTKSGYSTAADVLEELRYVHPAVERLLEYRTLSKLKSTYCDALSTAADSDSRVRSTFNQTETRTGRISSLEPNLQNIPVRRSEGKEIRRFFKAKDGYVLCDADYSQIELRVLAHIANDPVMCEAFKDGTDIHTLTAASAFGMPENMVTHEMRSRAKAVNFGIVYGIGAFSLARDIGVTRKEADAYIKSYLATYKGVDEYMKNIIEQAKSDGYVSTLFGRRRYLPELSASNAAIRSFGERVARNAPIQGTAADIIKIAMIKVKNRLEEENLDAKLILQVHDELIVECREDISGCVCRALKEEMEGAAKLRVPLTVDVSCGKTWFEAKE